MQRATSREIAQRFRAAVSRTFATASVETVELGRHWFRRGNSAVAVRYSRPYDESSRRSWWYGISSTDVDRLIQGGELVLVMPDWREHRFLFLDREHTGALLSRCKRDFRGDRKIHVIKVFDGFRLQEWPELKLAEFVQVFLPEVLAAAGIGDGNDLFEIDDDGDAQRDVEPLPFRDSASTRMLRQPRAFDPSQVPRPYEYSNLRIDPAETLVLREKASITHHLLVAVLNAHLNERGWLEIAEIPSAIDLCARRPTDLGRIIFECKTLNPEHDTSELHRCRLGLAQLLEYRFVHGHEDDELCLVTNAPLQSRRIEFLESLRIGHVWFRGSERYASKPRAKTMLDLKSP